MKSRKETYYGGYFWLTLVSFLVPLVVAYSLYDSMNTQEQYLVSTDASGVDHGIWDLLLKRYVADGKVDYAGMSQDPWLAVYIRQLGQADPEKLANDEERLALLLNAYNAFTIDGVISHKVQESVMNVSIDKRGFFDIKEHILAGQTVSLNQLENELIRKPFGDPRIHTALVCAAIGCPSIRREAYDGSGLDRQLNDQSKRFANNPRHVSFDDSEHVLRLNAILDWYAEDWDASGGVAAWLIEYVDDEVLKQRLSQARDGLVGVEFNRYDWTVNSQMDLSWEAGRGASSGAAPSSEFGSGSIPNG